MKEKKNEIIIFEDQGVKLEVNMQDETVWLTSDQMAELFCTTKRNIEMHIKNIYVEKELEENLTWKNFFQVKIEGLREVTRTKKIYNLDVIISVGYRVKSQNGIIFRKWANKILKDYMIKGYAVNNKRLEYLEKTVKLLDIANRSYDNTSASDSKKILRVITEYTNALDLLDDYDHKSLKKIAGTRSDAVITYDACTYIIKKLKYNEKSDIFALERDYGLKSILGNIYQSFNGYDVYPSIEEKAANF